MAGRDIICDVSHFIKYTCCLTWMSMLDDHSGMSFTCSFYFVVQWNFVCTQWSLLLNVRHSFKQKKKKVRDAYSLQHTVSVGMTADFSHAPAVAMNFSPCVRSWCAFLQRNSLNHSSSCEWSILSLQNPQDEWLKYGPQSHENVSHYICHIWYWHSCLQS